ncbi:hypothetical protein [Streptomyces pseudogriseolus]|uniref:hypothetical protein n=1 Tax=Streptomyces pseudogriseolus TaxID=36817 RepID=UPI003F9FA20E
MATAKERGRLGDIVTREMVAYALALEAAGYDWAAVWPTAEWEEGTVLDWLHGRFLLARECAAAIGHRFPDEKLTEFCREALEYRALYPDGPPELQDYLQRIVKRPGSSGERQ